MENSSEIEWYHKFEQTIKSPKGFLQHSLKMTFRLSYYILWIPIWLLTKIFPALALGFDAGKLFKLCDAGKSRDAVVLGVSRLEKHVARLARKTHKKPWFPEVEVVWFYFSAIVECALRDPKPEDEVRFSAIAEKLGLNSTGNDVSETFCLLARLAWHFNDQASAWDWTERALQADPENADAYYLKGWFGALMNRENPVECLFIAVKLEPDRLRNMRRDESLLRFPDFLAAVEARAKQAGIFVV